MQTFIDSETDNQVHLGPELTYHNLNYNIAPVFYACSYIIMLPS